MTDSKNADLISTGIPHLDALFVGGGLPRGSVVVLAGAPGSGKTILAQQIGFQNGSLTHPVLFFSTLSEPTAKTLRYLEQFDFFQAEKLDAGVWFVDLGAMLRSKSLDETGDMIMEHVKRLQPAMVVIDSFKVFDDLANSPDDLRRFGYRLAVNLMAWEATTILLGEYGPNDLETNPLLSIVDGLIVLTQREDSGEQQRFLRVVKMRGAAHSREEHPFAITRAGLSIFAARLLIHRDETGTDEPRLKTGLTKLDELFGEGISRGSSLLIGGVAGTGKTVLLLEFIYRGALLGEKGIVFSFEETEARLRATARGLGWDFDAAIARGLIEIVFIPQPEIMVESHLLMMRERIEAFGARRVAIDSLSVFLHKVEDPRIDREKTFQVATIIQNAGAVGFLATDIPYGANRISRFGVEETVVDGVLLLSSVESGMTRQRYIEVYKLRNTAHLAGRHNMVIGPGGITVFPRYASTPAFPALDTASQRRVPTGVPGLDALCGGGFHETSVTLVSGSAGIGKTTLAVQFVLEGVAREEPCLIVALEERPEQLLQTRSTFGDRLRKAVDDGTIELLYLPREDTQGNQFLSILTDRIQARGVRRLVLDGVRSIARDEADFVDLRQLLFALVGRFKALGVTSVLTLESPEMHSTESATTFGFSPIADNLLMLRYLPVERALCPTLTIVKTRGSEHDWGVHPVELGPDGIRITRRAEPTP